jgi:hypothetical protein
LKPSNPGRIATALPIPVAPNRRSANSRNIPARLILEPEPEQVRALALALELELELVQAQAQAQAQERAPEPEPALVREQVLERVTETETETAAIQAPLAAWAVMTRLSAPAIQSAAPWPNCKKSRCAMPSVGLIRYVGINFVVDELKNYILANFVTAPVLVQHILGLLKVDIAVNIILAAVTTRLILAGIDKAADTRLELRFHHSVVQQFTLGSQNVHTGGTIGGHTYAALVPHLDGLWRYGCEAFRLLDRPGIYNPFWTLISQDVRVSVPCVSLVDHTTYKRHYKTANGFSGKNVDLFIGNMVSLLARERVGAKKAMASLKEWDCWPVIRDHYAAKGKNEHGIYLHIKELLQERTIRWGRAI